MYFWYTIQLNTKSKTQYNCVCEILIFKKLKPLACTLKTLLITALVYETCVPYCISQRKHIYPAHRFKEEVGIVSQPFVQAGGHSVSLFIICHHNTVKCRCRTTYTVRQISNLVIRARQPHSTWQRDNTAGSVHFDLSFFQVCPFNWVEFPAAPHQLFNIYRKQKT